MVYLSTARLHFSGKFRADVATQNNLVSNYNSPNIPTGDQGWNINGGGGWRLLDCTITGVVRADGTLVTDPALDSAVGLSLAQPVEARLVDLDVQEMLSEIFGMQLQLGMPGQAPLLTGSFDVAHYADIWGGRYPGPGNFGGDERAGAIYQSQLSAVQFRPSTSAVLAELQAATTPGRLSIKFNIDGFSQSTATGRVVGTIGPATADEPAHFVLGRQCQGNPGRGLWNFTAIVDEQRGRLVADFGNSLQTTSHGGAFDPNVDFEIGLLGGNGQFTSLGRIPVQGGDWYRQTAGICDLPGGRSLTAQELTMLQATPIAVLDPASNLVGFEGVDGRYVREDYGAYRLSSRGNGSVSFLASRFGKRLSNASISLSLRPGGLASDLVFNDSATTDATGRASLQLTAGTVDFRRPGVDGVVCAIGYKFADEVTGSFLHPQDAVNVLVWSDYVVPATPTWEEHIKPILSQYAKLYPVMANVLDLADYDQVVDQADAIIDSFGRDITHPRYMPVTRDLSPVKVRMIIDWLGSAGADGMPPRGPVAAQEPAPILPLGLGSSQADAAARRVNPMPRQVFVERTVER